MTVLADALAKLRACVVRGASSRAWYVGTSVSDKEAAAVLAEIDRLKARTTELEGRSSLGATGTVAVAEEGRPAFALQFDEYEVVNLREGLVFLRDVGGDTGDWLGQILLKLPKDGIGGARPNKLRQEQRRELAMRVGWRSLWPTG